MKAIVGLVRFDSQPAEKAVIDTMLASFRHAQARSAAVWQSGPVAFGTATLGTVALGTVALGTVALGHSTQDSSITSISSAASSAVQMPGLVTMPHLHAVFDGRIDNRRELLQQLGGASHAALSDDELLLACYAKWGDETPAHLVGDYAFAIWDERTHKLFCARDHFGLRPFYLYRGPRFFIFASDLDAILAHPEVPQRINELRVALHLAVQPPDNRLTFYQEIERLLPAHSLTVTGTGATVERQYWRVDNISELRLGTDAEYADAFRELFTEAVACRIPAERPIGVLLSGGLDSTSVAAMLHKVLGAENDRGAGSQLHSFSALFAQTPECDEREYIDPTLQLGGITPHFVDVESSSPLARLDEMLTAMGEPFASPTMYIPWQLYQEASRQGVRIVFDGIDGDTAVHHGDAYLAELARAGQWSNFFELANAIAERKKQPMVNTLLYYYGNPYLRSLASRWQWFKLYREVHAIAPYVALSARRLFYTYVRDNSLRPLVAKAGPKSARMLGGRGSQTRPDVGVVSQTLVRQTELLDHMRAHERATAPVVSSRDEHFQQLTNPLLPQIFEISMRLAQHFGIEVRQPFTDRRLIEFCYALPPEQKVADGWTRNIVRRGLAGIIPEAIRLRGDKAVNTRAFTKGFLGKDAHTLDRLLCHEPELLAQYVDIPKLHEAYSRYRSTQNSKDEMSVWQSATLARWLQQKKEVPQTA